MHSEQINYSCLYKSSNATIVQMLALLHPLTHIKPLETKKEKSNLRFCIKIASPAVLCFLLASFKQQIGTKVKINHCMLLFVPKTTMLTSNYNHLNRNSLILPQKIDCSMKSAF